MHCDLKMLHCTSLFLMKLSLSYPNLNVLRSPGSGGGNQSTSSKLIRCRPKLFALVTKSHHKTKNLQNASSKIPSLFMFRCPFRVYIAPFEIRSPTWDSSYGDSCKPKTHRVKAPNSSFACLSPPVFYQSCDLFTPAAFLIPFEKHVSQATERFRSDWRSGRSFPHQFGYFCIPLQAYIIWYRTQKRVTLFILPELFSFLRHSLILLY